MVKGVINWERVKYKVGIVCLGCHSGVVTMGGNAEDFGQKLFVDKPPGKLMVGPQDEAYVAVLEGAVVVALLGWCCKGGSGGL
eukprot:4756754-Ditylum_brightwellii.AAC.1